MLNTPHDNYRKAVNCNTIGHGATNVLLAQNHAIVIGGGMGGLLASRVLSDHFEQVTLIERDRPSPQSGYRDGVPQSQHAHLLLKRGEKIISDLFPGIVHEMVDDGSLLVDSADIDWFHYGVWKANYSCGFVYCLQSRSHLERHIRRRLKAYANITWLEDSQVVSLILSPGGQPLESSRVVGVKINCKASRETQELLGADLVLDASGHSSQTRKWLKKLGYPSPPETHQKVNIFYNSRIYEPLPDHQSAWNPTLIYCRPPSRRRVGAILPLEGGKQWYVSMIGHDQSSHLKSDEDFLDYAQHLDDKTIAETIPLGKPITPIASFKFLANQRFHYEKLSIFPEGLIVLGDALCQVNPIYGQGISMVASEAIILDRCLSQYKKKQRNFSQYFFASVSPFLDTVLDMTMSQDMDFLPPPASSRSIFRKIISWYKQKIGESCATDSVVLKRFLQVGNMLKSSYSLLYPDVLFRIIASGLKG